MLPLEKLSVFINGWKIHFVNQCRGEYLKYLYSNELEVGLLPTPLFVKTAANPPGAPSIVPAPAV